MRRNGRGRAKCPSILFNTGSHGQDNGKNGNDDHNKDLIDHTLAYDCVQSIW